DRGIAFYTNVVRAAAAKACAGPVEAMDAIAAEGEPFDTDAIFDHRIVHHQFGTYAPLREALDVRNVQIHELVIELFQAGLVKTRDMEPARANILAAANEINGDRVAHIDLQSSAEITRKQDIDRVRR